MEFTLRDFLFERIKCGKNSKKYKLAPAAPPNSTDAIKIHAGCNVLPVLPCRCKSIMNRQKETAFIRIRYTASRHLIRSISILFLVNKYRRKRPYDLFRRYLWVGSKTYPEAGPSGTRTPDRSVMSRLLWPTELMIQGIRRFAFHTGTMIRYE